MKYALAAIKVKKLDGGHSFQLLLPPWHLLQLTVTINTGTLNINKQHRHMQLLLSLMICHWLTSCSNLAAVQKSAAPYPACTMSLTEK